LIFSPSKSLTKPPTSTVIRQSKANEAAILAARSVIVDFKKCENSLLKVNATEIAISQQIKEKACWLKPLSTPTIKVIPTSPMIEKSTQIIMFVLACLWAYSENIMLFIFC
jgi:hypothetical protein